MQAVQTFVLYRLTADHNQQGKFDNILPGNPACGQDRKRWLIEGFLDREFYEILTSTPCDLFQLLRGQTIWVVVFQDQGSTLPKLLWMDTPPQHFLTEFGEFPKNFGRPPHMCWYIGKYSKRDPLTLTKDHQLTTTDPKYQSVVEGGWRNVISRAVMAAADIPVLQIWNESIALWNYHRDNGAGWECTHYCFPSAPQVWVYHLLVKLRELQSV
ncbi:hypothetical protein WJX79_004140 [Trebouxia sp. C0005]